MDELFRKAGELYPLRTSESDWDGVLGKLREEISGESGNFSDLQGYGNRNRRRRLLLFLLLPLGVLSVVLFSIPGNKQKAGSPSDAANNLPLRDHPLKPNSTEKETRAPLSNRDKTTVIQDKVETKTERAKISGNRGTAASVNTDPGSQNTNSSGTVPEERGSFSGSSSAGEIPPAALASNANSLNSSGTGDASSATEQESFHEPAEKILTLTPFFSNTNPSVYGMPIPPLTKSGTGLNEKTNGAVTKSTQDKAPVQKGIYAALIGGPDLSTVAYQSTSQSGYSIGILLGYHFNKRLAVESGLLWDKKYYYSTGEHFDKNAANFPSSWNVLYLNGNCNMFEIPLNFRYNFATGINHGFFAEAGLSSYLMKKEYYDYSFTNNGSRPYSRDSTYNISSNYIFSVIQISAGYEHAIGKNTSIRVEPYLKIPIQGIGIGNMPVTSAGLYIGISHDFR